MASVKALLDQMASGKLTAAQVAADFRTRTWPAKAKLTAAQRAGVEDLDPPGENDWAAVETDSRVTSAQYAILLKARQAASGR